MSLKKDLKWSDLVEYDFRHEARKWILIKQMAKITQYLHPTID